MTLNNQRESKRNQDLSGQLRSLKWIETFERKPPKSKGGLRHDGLGILKGWLLNKVHLGFNDLDQL